MKRLGNFAIEEVLGDGGMSVVWHGRHLVLGTEAAIKVLRPEYARREPHRSAFFAEARSHAKLSHPGILRILDVGEVDAAGAAAVSARAGTPFIAMELAVNTLEDDLPVTSWAAAYGILLQILDALAHAHARGVVHRDLKPGNVLRIERDGERAYRIGDFGLAHGRDSTEEGEVAMGPTAGTPMYMSPEQINGFWRDFGPETDLYALGCVAYRLVCGRPPFEGETLFQIITGHAVDRADPMQPLFGVPPGLEAWVFRLLEKAPHKRFRRAADAAHALRELAADFEGAPRDTDVLPAVWTFGEETLVDADFEPSPSVVAPGASRSAMAGDGLGLFDLAEGPLIGRDEESRTLRATLLAARQHKGASVVLLRGPSGVGLSRLARSFATRMDELGLAFVHEATHTLVQAAHEGLAGLLERHFGTWGLERGDVQARVEKKLLTYGEPVADDVVAAVVEVICRSRAADDGPGYAFRTSRERSSLLDSALRLGHDDRPHLFLFDDVQWGRESLEFVRDRVEADSEAVFVLTVREDAVANSFADSVLSQLGSVSNATVLNLVPPPPEAVERFVASLLEFAPSTTTAIADAAGNEFRLARQIVGLLLETGGLSLTARGFELAVPVDELPRTWTDVWSRRLDVIVSECGLEDAALHPFEVAAELGHYPEPGELADALQIAGVAIDTRLLESLASRGLLDSQGDGWAFAEESLVAHLRSRVRAEGRVTGWSRACAEAVSRRISTRDRASRIAWHRIQGGDFEHAFVPMRFAILNFAVVDPDRAEELLGWWGDACDRLNLDKHAERRIDGLLMRANLAQARGQSETHRRLVDKALRRARHARYDEGEAWALLGIGQAALDDGELDFALDRFRRAEAKFRLAAEHEGRAHALFGAAFASMRLGAVDASIGDYRAAIEIFETVGNIDRALAVMSYLAYSHLVRGEFEAAEAYCRRAIDDARRLGDRAIEFESTSTLGEIARFRGEYDLARDYLQEVVLWRKTLGLRDAIIAEFNLALVELGAGNFSRAEKLFLRCEEGFVARGVEGRLPLVLLALAIARLGCGDRAGFEHFWGRVAPVLQGGDFLHIDAMWCAEIGASIAATAAPDLVERLASVANDQRLRLNRG